VLHRAGGRATDYSRTTQVRPTKAEPTHARPTHAKPTHTGPERARPTHAPTPPAHLSGDEPPSTDPGQVPLPAGARSVGAPDLNRYCSGWNMHAILRYSVTWGWRCSRSTVPAAGSRVGDQDISVDDACEQQYSPQAKSHYRDYNNPYSWFCWVPN
jgi:hypothetical protein